MLVPALLEAASLVLANSTAMELYGAYSRTRWAEFYVPQCGGRAALRLQVEPGNSTSATVEVLGYPARGARLAMRLQGSALEAAADARAIAPVLAALMQEYGGACVRVDVDAARATAAYSSTVASFGHRAVQKAGLMAIAASSELVPPRRPLGAEFRLRKLGSRAELAAALARFGGVVQHLLGPLPERLLRDRRWAFWAVVHIPTGRTVSRGMYEVSAGVAVIWDVATDEAFRRRGLASHVVAHLAAEAYRAHPRLQMLALLTLPPAAPLYAQLGFRPRGRVDSYYPAGYKALTVSFL